MSARPTVEIIQEIESLLSGIYTPAEVSVWWSAPHPLLGGKSAFDTIEDGNAEDVLRIVRQLDEAVYL